MKVIILAGGLGTRISEETHSKPKPMVRIGNKPIIWHIMQIYAKQGFYDFVIAAGYKANVIDEWIKSEQKNNSDWLSNLRISVKFTGENTHTGGRIKHCINEMEGDQFLATYGDGVANVDINKLVKFHKNKNRIATLTAVRPPARFGHLDIYGEEVRKFGEKNQADEGWINGGFFVINRDICEYITSENESLETGALPVLAKAGNLLAYKHFGFWQSMDTLRDKNNLTLIAENNSEQKLPWFLIQ
jgi:glucose-1-phosphate cytidylyltransferase